VAVPQLKQLTDIKDKTGFTHLQAIHQHWRAQGAKQQEEQFSDGTLRLIGLLWSLLEKGGPLLLEEPELSLNAGIIRHLPGLFDRLQSLAQRQLFLSTHSVDLLRDKGIGGEEVLLLSPSLEGTRVQIVSTLRDIRAMLEGGLSIADAVLPKTVPSSIAQLELSFNATHPG
jgi:predicted ATPase